MIRRFLFSMMLVASLAVLSACGDNDSAGDNAGAADTAGSVDFTELDRTWDADDSAFTSEYDSARAAYDRLAAQQTADTATRARLEAHNRMLQDIETRRAAARQKREQARAANDRAAYEAARAEANYQTWRTDLQRVRTEQVEIEGKVMVGTKSVGGVDVNARPENKDKPLIRVEPGKEDDKPLIRVEPGKEDDKPLIEKNKNP
jgi:hypothetical protein